MRTQLLLDHCISHRTDLSMIRTKVVSQWNEDISLYTVRSERETVKNSHCCRVAGCWWVGECHRGPIRRAVETRAIQEQRTAALRKIYAGKREITLVWVYIQGSRQYRILELSRIHWQRDGGEREREGEGGAWMEEGERGRWGRRARRGIERGRRRERGQGDGTSWFGMSLT